MVSCFTIIVLYVSEYGDRQNLSLVTVKQTTETQVRTSSKRKLKLRLVYWDHVPSHTNVLL